MKFLKRMKFDLKKKDYTLDILEVWGMNSILLSVNALKVTDNGYSMYICPYKDSLSSKALFSYI